MTCSSRLLELLFGFLGRGIWNGHLQNSHGSWVPPNHARMGPLNSALENARNLDEHPFLTGQQSRLREHLPLQWHVLSKAGGRCGPWCDRRPPIFTVEATVKAVASGSKAESAGLMPGDRLEAGIAAWCGMQRLACGTGGFDWGAHDISRHFARWVLELFWVLVGLTPPSSSSHLHPSGNCSGWRGGRLRLAAPDRDGSSHMESQKHLDQTGTNHGVPLVTPKAIAILP